VQATAPDPSGQFSFIGKWGDTYSITVLAQPPRELCSVKNGTGVVSANVSNVEVRCIGQVWNIYTAAGDGRPTSADSSSKSITASFYAPQGIAIDSTSGAIFVADTNSGAIRKLIYDLTLPATLASVNTAAGISFLNGLNNDGSNSRFNGPVGVAVDASAFATTKTTTIYVADTGNHLIRTIKLNADGSMTVATFAGSGIPAYLNETKDKAQFNRPTGIAVDSLGNIYVADTGNHVIRKITSAGVVSHFAGLPNTAGAADGPVATATFNSPMGVAVDTLGNVYVADTLNSTIRKISGGKVETLAGKAGNEGAKDGNRAAASFFRPTGVAIDSAFYLYVADTQNNIIRLVDQIGEVITIAGTPSPGSLDSYPSATCISFNNCSPSGGSFNRPTGIAVNKLGDLFVTDTGNNKIRYLTKTNPSPK
jgi:sugar lactone lactonase YvrE